MQRAIADAGKDDATLFLAYIGHGQFQRLTGSSGDFFLMPTNARKPTPREAIRFASFIEEAIYELEHINLFVLLAPATPAQGRGRRCGSGRTHYGRTSPSYC